MTMMKNYEHSFEIKHNPNCPYIPDNPNRIWIIGGPESGKINLFLNLKKKQHQRTDIEKIYSHVKNKFESKYQLLISGREKSGTKISKNSKVFIDFSQTIADVYENLEDCSQAKKRRELIMFDDMIADMELNKKLSA